MRGRIDISINGSLVINHSLLLHSYIIIALDKIPYNIKSQIKNENNTMGFKISVS